MPRRDMLQLALTAGGARAAACRISCQGFDARRCRRVAASFPSVSMGMGVALRALFSHCSRHCAAQPPRLCARCVRSGTGHEFRSVDVERWVGGFLNEMMGWPVNLSEFDMEVRRARATPWPCRARLQPCLAGRARRCLVMSLSARSRRACSLPAIERCTLESTTWPASCPWAAVHTRLRWLVTHPAPLRCEAARVLFSPAALCDCGLSLCSLARLHALRALQPTCSYALPIRSLAMW